PGGSLTLFSSCPSSLQPFAVWRRSPLSGFAPSPYGGISGGGKPGGEGDWVSTPPRLPAAIARSAPPSRNSASDPGEPPPGKGVGTGCQAAPALSRSNTLVASVIDSLVKAAPPSGKPATTPGAPPPMEAAAASSMRHPEPSFSSSPPTKTLPFGSRRLRYATIACEPAEAIEVKSAPAAAGGTACWLQVLP